MNIVCVFVVGRFVLDLVRGREMCAKRVSDDYRWLLQLGAD